MKAAHDALGKLESLEGLTTGVHLTNSAVKLVDQPHHAQFVIYSVPDDVAAELDCESRLTLGDPKNARREYGNYFGATFYIDSPRGKDHSLALLWGAPRRRRRARSPPGTFSTFICHPLRVVAS